MSPRQPIVVFDIETVPDRDHHAGDEFAKLLFHKVVAISYLRADICDGADGVYFSTELLRSGGEIHASECDLIRGFFQFVEKVKPRLVTFNGRCFDLPVLKYRALKHCVSAPWYAQGESKWENYGQRYSVDWHCDVMDALSEFGASKGSKLGEICTLLRIPCKLGLDGSQVESYVLAGRLEEVRNYCETDVIATYLVFLRFALFRGEISQSGYKASVESLKSHISAKLVGHGHFGEFLQAWNS